MAIDQVAIKQATIKEAQDHAAFAEDVKSDSVPIKTAGILARARLQSGTDMTTVTDEMRKKYGISDQESHAWKRNAINIPEWQGVAGNQSLDHWLSVMEGRVVTYKDTEGKTSTVRNGDWILCTYPKSVDDEFAVYQNEIQHETLDNIDHGDYQGNRRHRDNPEDLQDLRNHDAQIMADSGMLGEWKGQDWEKVMHNLGENKCKEIMAEHRGSKPSSEQMNEERFSEIAQNGAKGSSIISIPGNVRSKNHAGARK